MNATLPYFMSNNEWLIYDEKAGMCRLTDKAPPEAVKSYREEMNGIFSEEEESITDI